MKSFILINGREKVPVRAIRKFNCRGETWIIHHDPYDERKRTFVVTHQMTGLRAALVLKCEAGSSPANAVYIAQLKLDRITDERFNAAMEKARAQMEAHHA